MLIPMTDSYTPGESSEGSVSSLEESLGLTQDAQKLSRAGLHPTGTDKKKKQKTKLQSWCGENVQVWEVAGPLVESELEVGVKREKMARFDLTVLRQCERL